MQAASELAVSKEEWTPAAARVGNLSELFLTLGQVQKAVDTARQSVDFADRSGHAFEKWKQRYKLAGALHQIGRHDEAEIPRPGADIRLRGRRLRGRQTAQIRRWRRFRHPLR
ncbi:hypothetical protein IIA28_16695, partial [candidate division KSB1 bacterium]|nr:hypothetical protein [candidate division KSB1 bacterium]